MIDLRVDIESILFNPHHILSFSPYLDSLLAGCVYLDYNATTPIFPEVSAGISNSISSSCNQ